MRIALVNGDPGIPLLGPSGASHHLRAMAEAFVALGHEVRVLTTRLHPPRGVAPAALPEGITALDLPPRSLFYPLRRWPELRELRHGPRLAAAGRRAWDAHPPDLVYERLSLFTDAGHRLARAFDIPHVLEVNAPLAWERARFHGLRLYGLGRRWEARLTRQADVCVAVSTPLAAHLGGMGVPARRILVEPNGVDLTRFFPAPGEGDEGDEGAGGDEGDGGGGRPPAPGGPHLVFAGGFRPWHGLPFFADVLLALSRRLPEAHATLLGDGPERPAFSARLEALGLSGRVALPGALPQAEVAARLRSCDLALAPPPPGEVAYLSPLKIVEAMASGLPVVAHDRGDVPTLLGAGDAQPAGICLPEGDAQRWAAAILHLWEDAPRRRAMAAAGVARAQERAWPRVAQRVLDFVGAGGGGRGQ